MSERGAPPPEDFAEAGADAGLRIERLSAEDRRRLRGRALAAPLFAHAYSFHLNFRFGTMDPADLLDFAADQGLAGVKIHWEDGEERSLAAATGAKRRAFRDRAASLGLPVHLEISTTERPALRAGTELAREIGAESLRCYARYDGRVSDIVRRVVEDLQVLAEVDPDGRLRFTLEQHEDLTSAEMVRIVRAVGNPRLSLLFDFGNMINACERPLAALSVQAPLVTEVHLKDCRVVPDRGGWAHVACATGAGHIPIEALLVDLLLLGLDRPQVTAIGLEEEEDYFAPAYRFPNEPADPYIPARTASFTDPGEGDLEARLGREREAARAQVATVRGMLARIGAMAEGKG